MSAAVSIATIAAREYRIEIAGQAPRNAYVKSEQVIVEVKGGRGPKGDSGSGGASGISFAADPGPTVAAGERVLWVRPSGGSFSLIVREGR